jgi:hypothetical protein
VKLTKEDIMNDIQPEKVSLSFGLYVISRQDDESLQGYLNDFRTMFHNMLRKNSKDKLPNGNTSDPVVKQHNDINITRDVETATQRLIIDLEQQVQDMKLDKDSWKKVFTETFEWI